MCICTVDGESCLPKEFRSLKVQKILFAAFWNILVVYISHASYFSAETEFKGKHQKILIRSDIIGMLTIVAARKKNVICYKVSFQTEYFSQAF